MYKDPIKNFDFLKVIVFSKLNLLTLEIYIL